MAKGTIDLEQINFELELLNNKLTLENHERNRVEIALRDSEEKFKTLLSQLPVGVYRTSANGRLIHSNPAFAAILGFDNPDELLDINVNDLYYDPELRKRIAIQHNQGNEYYDYEIQLVRKDMNRIWVRDTGKITFDSSNNFDFLDGIIEDITARKQIEAALVWEASINLSIADLSKSIISKISFKELSELFLQHSLKLTNSRFGLIGYINSKTGLLHINSMKLEGVSSDHQPSKEIIINETSDYLLGLPLFQKTSVLLNRDELEHTIIHLDGLDIPVSKFIAMPVLSGNDNYGLIALANADRNYSDLDTEAIERITSIYSVAIQRFRSEEEMISALTKEQELNGLKSRFISMVSHEYRTPLQAILLSIELLTKYDDKLTIEERKSNFSKISASVKVMNNLLDKVILIEKVDSGGIQYKPAEIDLRSYCDVIVRGIEVPNNRLNRISLDFQSQLNMAYIDPVIIKEILDHLLNNAVKFSPETSGVDFIVQNDESTLKFIISDDGIGIPENEQNLVFTPFYRGSNIGTTSGTGLGLSIVKNLIRIIDGEIVFKSYENQGTQFFVTIPLKKNGSTYE